MKLTFDTIFGIINIDYFIIGFGLCVIFYYLFLEKSKKIITKETYTDESETKPCPCLKNKRKQMK